MKATGLTKINSTTNGGLNFTNQNLIGNNHAAFLSIDLYDSENGVAGKKNSFTKVKTRN